jgi:hypothetical protein
MESSDVFEYIFLGMAECASAPTGFPRVAQYSPATSPLSMEKPAPPREIGANPAPGQGPAPGAPRRTGQAAAARFHGAVFDHLIRYGVWVYGKFQNTEKQS